MKNKKFVWIITIYFNNISIITVFVIVFYKVFIKIKSILLIPPLYPFSIINNISISINNYNFTPTFFKQGCHADPGADRK